MGVDDVRSEASAADFLQATNKKLKVHYRGDHAQEALAVHDGRADQEHGAGRLSFSNDEGLSAIDASVAGGGIGVLEFSLQKSVRRDAAG